MVAYPQCKKKLDNVPGNIKTKLFSKGKHIPNTSRWPFTGRWYRFLMNGTN